MMIEMKQLCWVNTGNDIARDKRRFINSALWTTRHMMWYDDLVYNLICDYGILIMLLQAVVVFIEV